MILKATDVGGLAQSLLSRAAEARVTRVFQNSAYLETDGEFIVLLNGRLRSPMAVNLQTTKRLDEVLNADDRCGLRKDGLDFRGMSVETGEARIYRGSLGRGSAVSPLPGKELAKGMVTLRLLRDVSPPGLDIFSADLFGDFVRSVLSPLAAGEDSGVLVPQNYYPLLGLGNGFTPSGDDFVGSFAAAFNHMARVEGKPEIRLPRLEILRRTVPESAALLDYAQRGEVDEDLGSLVLSATGGRAGGFFEDLLRVAGRGHTSGLDMSVGVLLCAAAVRDRSTREGALGMCLGTLHVS